MAQIPLHKYFLLNSEFIATTKFVRISPNDTIYEVLRVIDGVPLFLEDHLLRFSHSAKLAKLSLDFTYKQISKLVIKLIQLNEIAEGNIMVLYGEQLQAYFIPHSYPTDYLYANGVVCSILHAERQNPNAKVMHTETRKKANHLMLEKGFYEVILVDKDENITEGSRSNMFFVNNDKLVTAPASTVLKGITRMKVIQLAHELNIKVEERTIKPTELSEFDAVFITGTSPKILPVCQIDKLFFDAQNKITGQISDAYSALITRYINDFKNNQ